MGQGSAKLESLALACGWFYDAHRAETDCHALLAVLALSSVLAVLLFHHPDQSARLDDDTDARAAR